MLVQRPETTIFFLAAFFAAFHVRSSSKASKPSTFRENTSCPGKSLVISGMNSPFPDGLIADNTTGMLRMLAAFAAQYAAFLMIVLSPDATPLNIVDW